MNRRNGFRGLFTGVALVVLAIPCLALAGTVLVSANQGGTGSGANFSQAPALNAKGSMVVFFSGANDLVPNNSTPNGDVYLRDIKHGTTTLVSANQAGTAGGNAASLGAFGVSKNGRFVAFQSDANDLSASDGNSFTDVFVRDVKKGTTAVASVNQTGTTAGNQASLFSVDVTQANVISGNGHRVVFLSMANDLVPNDTNAATDVFVRDLTAGTTLLISATPGGTPGNGDSTEPAITAGGKAVVFSSEATDLVANDANGQADVFVRDLKHATTALVSVNQAGTGSGDNGAGPDYAITDNGSVVVFDSYSTNLAPNDSNGTSDVFVRNLKRGTTTLASMNQTGTASGNGLSQLARGMNTVSKNGRYVVFQSTANDLVGIDGSSTSDVFVRDLKAGTTTLVSVNASNTAGGNGASVGGVISANGQFVSFVSLANDLVANDTNGTWDVFVRSLKTGVTRLASPKQDLTASGTGSSPASFGPLVLFFPVLGGSKGTVAFDSDAIDLVANDGNGATDVFVNSIP
jgi:hypothetical protein